MCLGRSARQKVIYVFFHPMDPARAEINKNEFPAHFICGMMMDLETNVSVHGTDIERETSRTALDDQNADPSKYCHLHFILNMSNSLVKFNPQEYVSTFYTDFICFTFRAIGLLPRQVLLTRHLQHNQISAVVTLKAEALVQWQTECSALK